MTLRRLAPVALLAACKPAAPPVTVFVEPAAAITEDASEEATAGARPRPPATAARASAPPVARCCQPGDPLCVGDELCPPRSAPSASPAAPAIAPAPIASAPSNATLVVPSSSAFNTGTDTLKPEADQHFQRMAIDLQSTPDVTMVRIEAHTDSDGNAAANQVLSERRALAVARWLVSHGISCTRLIPVGFGANRPLVPNVSPQEKAQNRRIVLVKAALRGRAIGGAPVDGGGKVAGDPCRSP